MKEMSDDLDNPSTIARFMFFIDTTNDQITIRYMKIQQALANIGGFIKVVILVIGLLIAKYQEIDYMNILIKRLYKWKERGIGDHD